MVLLANCIKLAVFIGFILIDACVHWYMYFNGPSVSGRCSSTYPELSVRLVDPEVMQDGGIRDGEEVYPKGAWWRNHTDFWGCPCSRGKPCLRKCCGLDESWTVNIQGDVECANKTQKNFVDSLKICEEKYAPSTYVDVKVSLDHYYILPRGCDGFLYRKETTPPVLLSDGSAWDVKRQFSWDQSDFCVDVVQGDVPEPAFHMCSSALVKFARYEYMIRVMSASAQVGSGVLVMVSLLVYSVVPRLRRGYGKAIMCYLVSELLRKVVFGMYLFPTVYMPCLLDSGPVKLFTALAVRTWLAVVSYHMYSMVGPVIASALQSRRQFLRLSLVAWGLPLVFAVLALAADRVPDLPDPLKPRFGGEKCFFQNQAASWIYMTAPSVVSTVATMGFCVATLARLAASRRRARTLKGPDSRRHCSKQVQWSCLYVKVCLIAKCMNYLVNTVLALMARVVFVPPAVLLTSEDILAVRGVEVFLIFVCQKQIILEFLRNLAFWRK